MARRVDSFDIVQSPRRYDWTNWTDGSIWEITRGEDYEVATENMRVNLHEKARQQGRKVTTQIVRTSDTEGLRFQFFDPDTPPLRARSNDRRYPTNDSRRFKV